MYRIVDAEWVPMRDAHGCELVAVTLDEAEALLAFAPDGIIVDTETGKTVFPREFGCSPGVSTP